MLDNNSGILNALQGAAAVLDENGDILISNHVWEKESNNSAWLKEKSNGLNYLQHFQILAEHGNDYALRLLIGVREVLRNERETFSISVASENSQKKWHKVTVSALEEDQKKCVLMIFDDISDSMKTILSLRKSEAKYRYQFKYSTSAIMLAKPNGEILDVNQAACQILGYSKKELVDGGRSLIADESDPAHLEMIRIREENSFFEGEKEYKHKDGHFIPVQMTSVIHTTDGGGKQIINTFHDLREKKESKFTLEEERRFSKTALNSIPSIFFVIDSKHHFMRWNDALLSGLGYNENEFMKLKIPDIFETSKIDEIDEVLKTAFETGHGTFIGRVVAKDGSSRTFHIYFNKFENNGQVFLDASGVDITDFIESEKKREKNYRLLTEMFDNSPIAIVQINPANEVQKINQAFTDLFGFTEQEILGKNVNDQIAAKNQIEEANRISREAFHGQTCQNKTIRFTKCQTEVPVLITTVPVRNNGDIIAVYGMYVDLTEQVKLEKNLKKSLHEKEILLQEVHHRVKNNLAIIASLLELQLVHETGKDAKQQLREAHNRIYSIAKIHEALYNRDEIAQISFKDYLTSLTEAMPKLIKAEKFQIDEHTAAKPLILNINQAVPLGLLMNELVNLGMYGKTIDHHVKLSYKTENDMVTLIIEGMDNQYEDFLNSRGEFTFQNLLIKTFIEQIDADVEVEKDHSSKIFIKFRNLSDEQLKQFAW